MANCDEVDEITDHVYRMARSGRGRDDRASQVVTQRNPCSLNSKQILRICTWNVRSMYESGKIHNTIKEMTRLQINIMGISEMRWPGSGERNVGEHKVYYAGTASNRHENGVGIIINKSIQSAVIGCIAQSDRIIMLKLRGIPFDINIIQVYAPTSDKGDDEVDTFYDQIETVMKNIKNRDVTIIMGDFNAKVGQGSEDKTVGSFGLGQRNQRGDRLVQFCREKQLIIANTFFKLPPRRLYTWKSPADKPGKTVRNQIDFVLINERFRNSTVSVKTYPGADVYSDHNPLVCRLKIKLKKEIPSHNNPRKYDVRKLGDPVTQEKVKIALTSALKDIDLASSESENTWNTMETKIIEVGGRFLQPDRAKQKKKTWMTEEILDMMEERRRAKSVDSQAYGKLHRTIKKKIREAKEKWMTEKCHDIEDLNSKHDTFNVHKKIKEATGRFRKNNSGNITDEQGNLVLETEKKIAVWKKYIEQLFNDEQRPDKPHFTAVEGPQITLSEVKHAINLAKKGKATGPDDIPAEFFKIMEDDNIKTLTTLFNKIYDTGVIPEKWLISTFITLPKKSNTKSCEDFRTISLMCHVLKIFLKVIHARIYRKCEENSGETQFGFKNGLGTREALFAIQVLIQRCRDVNCDVFVCFLDYKKAFDRCRHEKMIQTLTDIDLDGKDIRLITNLYWGQKATIRVENMQSNYIEIKKGVRQGCVLSPLLFNLYSNCIFKEALENSKQGIKVNGEVINNIRYADDTVLIADSLEGLQELINNVAQISEEYGLDLNINKTKYMVISKNPIQPGNLSINKQLIERKAKFTYLGCTLNETWDHSQEIRCRIEQARTTFVQMKPLLSCRDLSLSLKKRIVACYVYSTLLYGAEAWTLSEAMERKLQAFEMWIFRRILRISWVDRVTNEDVLQRMGCEPELLFNIKRRKLEYFGHIMRNTDKYRILQNIVQGKVEGRRGPGRRRISWLANLRKWFGTTSTELFRNAVNKVRIAMMIANIRNRIGQ